MKKLIHIFRATGILICSLAFLGCSAPGNTLRPDIATQAAQMLTVYDWEDDLPQEVFDKFKAQTGIQVLLQTYPDQDTAAEDIQAKQAYDLVVMNSPYIPKLQAQGLLKAIDPNHISNLGGISPQYRDQLFGLKERYAVPYSYGSMGLVVRSDRVKQPIRRWADLWEKQQTGRVGIWKEEARETIAMTLKTLGYSANSENPAELQQALEKLLQIRWSVVFLEDYAQLHSGSPLSGNDLDVIVGYAEDVRIGRQEDLDLEFVYPQEGALLWFDAFVIPVSARNPAGAEAFLDFVLQPEISAQITNVTLYAAPIKLAQDYVQPDLLANSMIYPSLEHINQAELLLPLSPAGEVLYQEIWNRFLTAQREE